ncbi:MAG TPA: hypothetical protein VJI71_01910, partial [Candidatus Norongarragalinales archaeon]|nr:hypothetical protein [Candidatus Norongarragalinales archaeon]
MLSKGFPEKTFCLLVIALLFVELLTPFAYAAGEEEKKVESIIQYPTGFVGSEACTTNPITPQERQTLYDNTIGKPIEQLTDLPLETALQAAQTPVQNPLSPDAPLNPFLESSANPLDQKISLASLAALMGVEKKELVEKYVDDFDEEKDDVNEVADNTFVSLAQAQAIARDKGGTAKERVDDIISKYFGIGGSQTSALPTPSPEPYANLKIILPGSPGRELTYNQLAAAQALNSESCLLNGEIKGKVSYLALLNADLTYGIPNDETLSGQYVYAPSGKVEGDLVDPRSNQWLVGNTILSILSLNGGANILVPSFYEDWIAFTGVWTRADAIISVATSLAAKSAADNIAKIKTAKTELKNSLLSSQAAREEGEIKSLIANDIYGPIQKQGGGLLYSTKDGKKVIVKSVFDVDVVTDKIIKDVTEETTDSILKTTAKTTVTAEGKEITTTVVEQTFKSPVAGAEPVLDQVVVKSTYAIERGQAEQVVTETIREDGTKILTTITTETQTVDAAQVLKITPEAGGAGLDVPIARENSVDGVLKQQGLSPVRVPNTGYENEIAQGMKMEASWNRLKRQVLGRVSYNLMMGGGWLGPARLAYDIADRNLFSASGFNDNKYLKVFVNKAVAQKFKSGTDVFGIGGVQELIGEWTNSELTTPSKAFKVGSVFLGNFPQGGSEDRESKTIVSSSSGWQITTSWKGSSNAVNFEDVRSPGRESFTSLPLVTNEILPEAVVNSKLGGSAYNFLLTLGLP